MLPELRMGGAQKVMLILAKEIAAKGFCVDLVVLSREGKLLSEIPDRVRAVFLGEKTYSMGTIVIICKLIRLVQYLRKERPHAMLSTLTGTNLLAILACLLSNTRCRLVIRQASTLANIKNPAVVLLMKLLFRIADGIVALSDVMKEELVHRLHLPSERINILPNPLDREKIDSEAIKPLPSEYQQTSPYIVAVGRLAPPKDYFSLIKAFAEVSKTLDLNLVIIGEGPDRERIEDLVGRLSLKRRVYLRGMDANPYRWIARSSFVVHASRWEGYPNVIIESLYLQKYVIATRYDVSVENIVGKQRGIVIPVGDTGAIATAITTLYGSNTISPETPLPDETQSILIKYLQVLGLNPYQRH